VDGLAVLRRFGYDMTHLARVEPDWFQETQWIGPPYSALHEPTVALCRTILKPDGRGLPAMREGTRVKCRLCRRIATEERL
jgi:hypothetical protein